MALHPNPLSVRYLRGVIKQRPDHEAWRRQYIGTTLLRPEPVPAYNLEWDEVKTENNLAGFYSLNGRPVPGPGDLPFETKYAELKNVMAARIIHPNDVMILREPGELAVSKVARNMREKSQRRVRDKIAECDDEVDATIEYMIMHALQGTITWPPLDEDGNKIDPPMSQWGNVEITINFPIRGSFVQAATTLVGFDSRSGAGYAWTDETNADPVKDLEVIAELISETTGMDAHGSTIIMGSGLLSRLAFNAKIIAWIKGTDPGINYVAAEEMINFVKTRIGYTIKPYAAKWTYRTNLDAEAGPTTNAVAFLGRNKCLIIPPGLNPGYLAVGPSPDGQYQSGKYQWSHSDDRPPWETEVGEGQVCFPIVDRINEVFVFDAGS